MHSITCKISGKGKNLQQEAAEHNSTIKKERLKNFLSRYICDLK